MTALSPSYLYSVTGDTSGNVYVASESSPGTPDALYLLTKVAPDGSIAYQTKLPYIGALAPGDSGSVWVLGTGKVDAQGNFTAMSINGQAIGSDASGRVYLATNTESGIAVSMFDTSGKVLATSNTGIQGIPAALAVDTAGAVYLTGEAQNFVATPGAFQTTNFSIDSPSPSGFVAKIAPGLGKVVYATLLGGTTGALCFAIVVDAAGEAIVGGSTFVDPMDYQNYVAFPLTHVGLPLLGLEGSDAYVLKLSADGSHLIYSLGLGDGAVSSLALAANGNVHAAGAIGPSPGLVSYIFNFNLSTAGLVTIDPQGSVLLEQHLAPAACCAPSKNANIDPYSAVSLAGVAVAADGSPRWATTIASQEFPPVYADQAPAPYVIDALPSPPLADISVTAATVQPLARVLDLRVTVTNAGPATAEGVHIVLTPNFTDTSSDLYISALGCIPGPGTICYPMFDAVVNSLGPGQSASIESLYSVSQDTPTPVSSLTVSAEVFAATFDPNPGNNKATLIVPIVSGQLPQFGINPGDLTFYGSNAPGFGPCATCPSADPNLTVWAPTPQTSADGNTWYFNSWSDGVKDNPRAFDASQPLPALLMNFLPLSPVSLLPTTLDFVGLPGIAPPQRSIQVSALNPQDSVSAGAPADPWLSISQVPASNSIGGFSQIVTGTVSTAGLAPGHYTSSFPVTLTTNHTSRQTIQVPVSLRIMEQAPAINASGVVSAASYASGTASKLEMISIFGSGLGPSQAATAIVPQAGSLPTVLGGTRVLVTGTNSTAHVGFGPDPAQLLFAQDGQISAIIPSDNYFNLADTVVVQVEVGGIPGPTMSVGAAVNAPGLFTSNASGQGNLAAVNSDGTINSPSNPAKRGTYISLYGTGFDMTVPNGVGPGVVQGNFGTNLLSPVAGSVEALVGTEPAEVEYAGFAPGLVAAAQQINVLIPADSQTGPAVPIQVGILDTYSTTLAWVWTQAGVTIAIQ